jgi:hypothetical protein
VTAGNRACKRAGVKSNHPREPFASSNPTRQNAQSSRVKGEQRRVDMDSGQSAQSPARSGTTSAVLANRPPNVGQSVISFGPLL